MKSGLKSWLIALPLWLVAGSSLAAEFSIVGRWQTVFVGVPPGVQMRRIFEANETTAVLKFLVSSENPVFGNQAETFNIHYSYTLGAPIAGMANTYEMDAVLTGLTRTLLSQHI